MQLTIPPAIYWHEGMLLLPQHFQLNDERTDSSMAFYSHALNPYNYGVLTISVDQALLSQKILHILELEP